MLFDAKFDLIFSLGDSCACTSYIRRYNLQNFSYPFDWIRGGNLGVRIDYLLNNFNGFCAKDNLEKLDKGENSTEVKCDYYIDRVSGLYFIHDFASGVPFDEAYSEVMEKYERRINRLFQEINASQRILCVWQCSNGRESEDNLCEYYRKLRTKFSEKDIYMLILEHSTEEESFCMENNHIMVLRYDNSPAILDERDVMGNQKRNMEIFAQIRKHIPLKELPKAVYYKIIKILIGMVPSRKIRPVLREYFDRNFYRAKL